MNSKGRLRKLVAALAMLGACAVVVAQTQVFTRAPRVTPGPPPIVPAPASAFGAPLAGLSTAQLQSFADGLEEFTNVDTPDSGLGPIFNNVSCVACHSIPAAGGGSAILETRFGRLMNGHFDPLTASGGSLLQQSAIAPECRETVPPEANVIALRQTTPLFGLGLIEAIPDQAILRNAQMPQGDKVAGRPSMIVDVASGTVRVGRFGWKAQQATILAFAGDAYLNEMGITNRLFPTENAPNGNAALLAQCDHVADIEDQVDPATGKSDIDRLADFMRLLAAPPQVQLTPATRSGQDLFARTGCAACHTPSMSTGPSDIAALDRKAVNLYSDLLLHDMGALGDGIGQAAAAPIEMRTAPLWGLRARGPYLHDGRAATVDVAIRLHDGTAASARNRYLQLPPNQQVQLLQFLLSI